MHPHQFFDAATSARRSSQICIWGTPWLQWPELPDCLEKICIIAYVLELKL